MNAAKRRALLFEVLVNFVLPWLIYRYTVARTGETGALLWSAVPPLAWSVVELLRFRRVDALSAMVLVGIVLSLGAMALGGTPRMLLMRESLVSGMVGVAFLLSLSWRRPLIYYLARATIAREARVADTAAATNPGAGADALASAEHPLNRFERLWEEDPQLTRAMRLMSAVWGGGLVGETLLRAWLAWTWPVERFLVVSPFLSYGIFGGLTAWTFWYRSRRRRAHLASS